MAEKASVILGQVGPRAVAEGGTNPSDLFPDVIIDNVPGWAYKSMNRSPGWHTASRGAKVDYVREVPKLAVERKWNAVNISGAPVELMNPGIYADLAERLSIPVTTVMVSSIAAMKAFGVQRALLMTGFFEGLDEMLYGYFCHDGIELVWPDSKPFADYASGSASSPEQVLDLTEQSLASVGKVDAIYFQGALNNRPVIEGIEAATGLPVVSSNLASQWYMLSKLGKKYNVKGVGRLFSEWPAMPKGR